MLAGALACWQHVAMDCERKHRLRFGYSFLLTLSDGLAMLDLINLVAGGGLEGLVKISEWVRISFCTFRPRQNCSNCHTQETNICPNIEFLISSPTKQTTTMIRFEFLEWENPCGTHLLHTDMSAHVDKFVIFSHNGHHRELCNKGELNVMLAPHVCHLLCQVCN